MLTLIYAVSSPGATLYMHICCGKFNGIDLNNSKDQHCPLSEKSFQKGCCDNKQVELKIKSEYKAETEAKFLFKDITAYISLIYSVVETPLFISNKPLHFSGVSPPLSTSVPLYIFNCVYRI